MGASIFPALITGLVGLYTARKQEAAMDRATSAAREAAAAQEARAVKAEKAGIEAQNAANQKKPNTEAILSQARQAGKGGASGTMLTGPAGIAPSDLTLGKRSLLGE